MMINKWKGLHGIYSKDNAVKYNENKLYLSIISWKASYQILKTKYHFEAMICALRWSKIFIVDNSGSNVLYRYLLMWHVTYYIFIARLDIHLQWKSAFCICLVYSLQRCLIVLQKICVYILWRMASVGSHNMLIV